jgi:F-type H+-transporting ATPase subunit b
MRIDWSTLALQLINFAILIVLLQRFLYRPVLRMIDARQASIDAARAEARKASEEARVQRTALEAEHAAITAERSSWLDSAAAQAQTQASARRAEAESAAVRLMESTREELAQEREQMQVEMRLAALELAVELTRRLIAELPEPLRAEAWLERIVRHLESLEPAERAALAGELEKPGSVVVVTAWPVSSQSADHWRAKLSGALGREASMTFEIDPQLIAGAELHFAYATLRFGLRGVVERLRQERCASGGSR